MNTATRLGSIETQEQRLTFRAVKYLALRAISRAQYMTVLHTDGGQRFGYGFNSYSIDNTACALNR